MCPNERADAPPPFEWRVPTTAEDVAVLRRLGEAIRRWPLTELNRLNPPSLFPIHRSRRTSAGFEPFRL